MNNKVDSLESQAIEHEIAGLERKLQEAKGRLNASRNATALWSPPDKLRQSNGMNGSPSLLLL
jgi:hypothetical protein